MPSMALKIRKDFIRTLKETNRSTHITKQTASTVISLEGSYCSRRMAFSMSVYTSFVLHTLNEL